MCKRFTQKDKHFNKIRGKNSTVSIKQKFYLKTEGKISSKNKEKAHNLHNPI